MLNEFGSYAGTLDPTKNDLATKPADKSYCANPADLGRPQNLSVPSASWNYPYRGNFYNYYANTSYEISDVHHQYDNQKCGAQLSRNYSQHPPIQSTSVLQCCDPRCQLLTKHPKYPFNHNLNNKLTQRSTKRPKNYYSGVLELPKSGPETPSVKSVLEPGGGKYAHCGVPSYPSLQNDLTNKYNGQQTDYGSQYHGAIKPSKHVLLPDSKSFSEYYTNIGKPSCWNKQNVWHRNVPTSCYPPPPPPLAYESDKGINGEAMHEQSIATGCNERGILFNRLLDRREHSYNSGYTPTYYYDKSNQLAKGVGEYPGQGYSNREHAYGDISNNTRLPLQNNNGCHPQPQPMCSIPYPHHNPPPTTSCYKESSVSKDTPSKGDEKSRILEKNPNLDVRQFLSTWDDDVEEDKAPESGSNEAPVIVLDCSTLEGDVLAKVKEKLGGNIAGCEFDSPSNATVLKIIENGDDTVLSPHTSVIQDSSGSTGMVGADSCQKRNSSKNDSGNTEKSAAESSHLNSDGFLTWYSNTKKKDELSYDLVEMTERLVNTVDKLFSEPDKKRSRGAEYNTKNAIMMTSREMADKSLPPENEWNINFNYKKIKNSMSETTALTSSPPLPPTPIVIQTLDSNSQHHLPRYNQYAGGPAKENSFSEQTGASPVPTYRSYAPTTTYINDPKEQQDPANHQKNVSCSFNLHKTSNDFKFSVNYSKQAVEYNAANNAHDFLKKYKNADGYPMYEYPKYKTALINSTATIPTTATNEFYKNFANYNSCCYDNSGSGFAKVPVSKECTTMNYVEHIDKGMAVASDKDITLVKADLEKSLNEITHQFSYQKQNLMVGRTEETNVVNLKSDTAYAETNYQQNVNYFNNKEVKVGNEKVNSTMELNMISSDAPLSYNGVIQKVGGCGTRLFDSEKKGDDCLSTCDNSLLSMPSLSPPSSPKTSPSTKQNSVSGVNLTLNDVYENNVIFNTEGELGSGRHEKDQADGVEVTNFYVKPASVDTGFQPLNLALSKDTKKHDLSPSPDNVTPCSPVEMDDGQSDKDCNVTNTNSATTDVDCSNAKCSNISTDTQVPKVDDGYYSAENKNDSYEQDADDGAILNVEKIPRHSTFSYQTCIVSREQYENSLEQEALVSESHQEDKSKAPLSLTKTSPYPQDLSTSATNDSESKSASATCNDVSQTVPVLLEEDEDKTNESMRHENELNAKLVIKTIPITTINCEDKNKRDLDDLKPVVVSGQKNNTDNCLLEPVVEVNVNEHQELPQDVHKSFGNWEDSVPLDEVPETNPIRRLTQTYEKLSDYNIIGDYRANVLTTKNDDDKTKKFKHKHKKFKLKKLTDNKEVDVEVMSTLDSKIVHPSLSDENDLPVGTSSVIKETENYMRKNLLCSENSDIIANRNGVDESEDHLPTFKHNLPQDPPLFKCDNENEPCAFTPEILSASTVLMDTQLTDSNAFCELSHLDPVISEHRKPETPVIDPMPASTNAFVEVQNLDVVDSEYMKLKKRKLSSVKDTDLPVKKRKQDVDCLQIRLNNELSLAKDLTTDTKLDNELHMNSNIENEQYFNQENKSRDDVQPSLDVCDSHTKRYKRKRKKEKIKLKRRPKKMKRRFSLSENMDYDCSESSIRSDCFHPKYFKRSKSLNQFSLDEKYSDCRVVLSPLHIDQLSSLLPDKYPNLCESSLLAQTAEADTEEPTAKWPPLPVSPCYQNTELDQYSDSNVVAPSPTTILSDSEKDESANITMDDELFNIPSIAPTPHCDLIRDDNVDIEPPKTPDASPEVPLDMDENSKETCIPCFTYSAPTPNCYLKHDIEDEPCTPAALKEHSPYSVGSCSSLIDDVDASHTSKAPSPNCDLNDDSFTNEKAPSPCCILNETNEYYDVAGDEDKENCDFSSVSSVAPSPNCDIIEGVLLDDSDYSKHCDEFEQHAMSTDENENITFSEVPSLRNLAKSVLSKMQMSTVSAGGNRNLLEVWVSPEKTQIIIHSEDQESTDVVFSNSESSNVVITDADTSTYNDMRRSPGSDKLKDISFDYYPIMTLDSTPDMKTAEKSEEDLQCQCLIISSEESILCLRCSMNSSVIVNQDERIENGYQVSIDDVVNKCDTSTDTDNVEIDRSPYFSNECIEESFIDQNIRCTPSPNERAKETLPQVGSTVDDVVIEDDNEVNLTVTPKVDKLIQIKVQLPWHKIFYLGDTNSVEHDEQKMLELGPAQIEIRLSPDDAGLWKMVNSNNGNASPVVKVKRLVLQRALHVDSDVVQNLTSNENETPSTSVEEDTSTEPPEVEQPVNEVAANIKIGEILRVPKMVIKKTSYRKYKSYLRTNSVLQPVVRLYKSKSLDELALKYCNENCGDVTINLKEVGKSLLGDWNENIECGENTTNDVLEEANDSTTIKKKDEYTLRVGENRSDYVENGPDSQETATPQPPAKRERHHCLLCHRSYPTGELYCLHLKSEYHLHLELTQRQTIHALYRHFTGRICPRLKALNAKERKIMRWKPRNTNVNHFYHRKTPLQIALHKSVFGNKRRR